MKSQKIAFRARFGPGTSHIQAVFVTGLTKLLVNVSFLIFLVKFVLLATPELYKWLTRELIKFIRISPRWSDLVSRWMACIQGLSNLWQAGRFLHCCSSFRSRPTSVTMLRLCVCFITTKWRCEWIREQCGLFTGNWQPGCDWAKLSQCPY
jgi:hypothetical protein